MVSGSLGCEGFGVGGKVMMVSNYGTHSIMLYFYTLVICLADIIIIIITNVIILHVFCHSVDVQASEAFPLQKQLQRMDEHQYKSSLSY